ncbi:EpsG family protein [Chryseobacterium sp. GMJ5]|uniref:EpsG family protein n=1 Tax=Chryseobacterium gilvum TaxID=2976534 RepID=A0ABT2VZL3_9FLAO|nr:EpsG family protein [Chryseobacterium gilvum]MCU7615074.1 EpsG family protein [Chryseobacterium gilvum]
MILLLFILFTIVSIFFIIDTKNKVVSISIIIVLAILLILTAGFRDKDIDNDYYIYFDKWRTNNMKADVEYSFILIKDIIKNHFNLSFIYLLLTYATLGVVAKLHGIKKLSPFLYGSILIYLSHYYILHEITQIRIGVATGFLLISFYYKSKNDYVNFFVFMIIAIFFHQSSSMALFLILVNNTKKNLKPYLFLVPAGYLLYFSNTYFNLSIPIPYFQSKIEVYKEATEAGFIEDSTINVFNILFLLRIAILYLLVYFEDRISIHLPSFFFLIKTYAISLFTFLFFSDIPVFAFRIQELFGVVEIILFPSIIFIFSARFMWIGKLIVWCLALGLLLIDIYYIKLVSR